jgi:hypothetical protein
MVYGFTTLTDGDAQRGCAVNEGLVTSWLHFEH